MNEIKHTSKINGLYFITKKIASFRYLSIIHKKSGMPIVNFNSPVVKVTNLMKMADKILKNVDWNIPESKFTEKHGKAVLELKKHVIKDESGKYYVE